MKAFFIALFAFFTALTNIIGGGELKTALNTKGDITGYSQIVTENKALPDFTVDEDGDFTILQFTDTHFTTCMSLSDLVLLNKMKEQTKKYKPDLVVICGDMINDGDSGLFSKSYVLDSIAKAFEELNQYWSYVPGNNDGLNYGTSEDVTAYLSQYEHCLVGDEKDISGGAQYSLDIYSGNELTHSLVFLDTMDYDPDPGSKYTYGYVKEDQVNWVKEELTEKKLANPSATVSVFMHEDSPAFYAASEKGSAYKIGYPTILERPEKYKIPKNQPLDNAMKEVGNVGLVSIGHIHPPTSQCNFFNGTYYHIAPQTTISSVLITIRTDAENTKAMYDFATII